MNLIFILVASVLFFVLSPGILLRLPPNGSKYVVALVHSIVFGLIVLGISYLLDIRIEGMTSSPKSSESILDTIFRSKPPAMTKFPMPPAVTKPPAMPKPPAVTKPPAMPKPPAATKPKPPAMPKPTKPQGPRFPKPPARGFPSWFESLLRNR
jgi:hypothetical protein